MSQIYDELKNAELNRVDLKNVGLKNAAPKNLELKPDPKNPEPRNVEQFRGSSHIPAGLRIKGEISGNEDLFADGAIEGPVNLAEATLSVGERGNVKGNISAGNVVVHGVVTGNVEASDRIEIAPKGSIVGDIATSRIVIHDGGHCKGSIEIGRR